MKKFPKPWLRPSRGVWYVTLDGKQINLGPDKEAAFTRYHELMARPREKSLPSDHVATIADHFLDWVKSNRAAETFEWYRYRLQRFVDTHPLLTVRELRPYHVERWADGYGLSKTSRRNYLRGVKRCMAWAAKQGYIDRSPIENMEVPTADRKEVYVPPDEFEELCGFFSKNEAFLDLITVTYQTGCRPQESLVVEAKQVDTPQSRWIFTQSGSKGKRISRVIYMTDEAMLTVRKRMLAYPEGPIFRNTRRNTWTTDAVNCRFYYYKQKTGKQVSLYALRHSWATNALQRGVDSLTVSILMGHEDPSTLARVYQHLSMNPDHLRDQLKKAAG